MLLHTIIVILLVYWSLYTIHHITSTLHYAYYYSKYRLKVDREGLLTHLVLAVAYSSVLYALIRYYLNE